MPQIIHCYRNLLHAPPSPDLGRFRRIHHIPSLCLEIHPHQHGSLIYNFPHANNSALIQLCIINPRLQRCPSRNSLRISNPRLTPCHWIILFKRLICPITRASEHAARKRIRIHNNTVILIISCKGPHRQNQVCPVAHLTIRQIIII